MHPGQATKSSMSRRMMPSTEPHIHPRGIGTYVVGDEKQGRGDLGRRAGMFLCAAALAWGLLCTAMPRRPSKTVCSALARPPVRPRQRPISPPRGLARACTEPAGRNSVKTRHSATEAVNCSSSPHFIIKSTKKKMTIIVLLLDFLL